jgi:Fe-S cluster assembly protein SufD
MSVDVKTVDQEWIRRFSEQRGEPRWMTEFRLNAFELAEKLPLPKVEKMRIQRWRLDRVVPSVDSPFFQDSAVLPELKQEMPWLDEKLPNLLIQQDGSVSHSRLDEELQRQGVVFQSLDSALHRHEALIREHFMTEALKVDENRLTALHASLWSGGVFVYVPPNREVELPLQALFRFSGQGLGFYPHVLVIADENSSLTLVDHCVSSQQAAGLHVGVTEVYVKRGARVRYATVHLFNQAITDISYRRAVVAQDGQIEWILGEMNDGNTLAENNSILKGKGASSASRLIAIGTGKQQANYQSRNWHIGQHTNSEILSRGVTRDQSWLIVDGVTKIEKGARRADGRQAQSVLMLSEHSRGDANPILYIDENDVQAGHAAGVGQVSAEQLYYLMSRGIPKEEAEYLIILGFLEPVVSRIPVEGIRQQLHAVIERKLRT